MRLATILLLAAFTSKTSTSSTLPYQLTQNNVNEVTRRIGGTSPIRALRSAEAYDLWPGLKFGFEVTLSPIASLRDLGDGTGRIDGINFVPRLYFSKGLTGGFEITFCYFPSNIINTVTSAGALLKYNFFTEQEDNFAIAAFLGYTSIEGFDHQYSGKDVEIGGVISRDLVRLKPYVGMGFVRATGSVLPSLTAPGVSPEGSGVLLHLFLGAEFEFPAHVTAQLDLFNLYPTFTLLVSKRL